MIADELAERLANLSPAKRALLELRLKEKGTTLPIEQTIPRRSSDGPAPPFLCAGAVVVSLST